MKRKSSRAYANIDHMQTLIICMQISIICKHWSYVCKYRSYANIDHMYANIDPMQTLIIYMQILSPTCCLGSVLRIRLRNRFAHVSSWSDWQLQRSTNTVTSRNMFSFATSLQHSSRWGSGAVESIEKRQMVYFMVATWQIITLWSKL